MFTNSLRYARIIFAGLVLCWLSLLVPTAVKAMSFQQPARWQVSGYSGPVAWSPTGECLAVAQNDGSVVLLNPDDGTTLHTLRGYFTEVTCITFSPDGQTLATDGWNNSIDIWNVKDGTLVCNLAGQHNWMITTLAFSPNGQTIASGSEAMEGTTLYEINIWQIIDG